MEIQMLNSTPHNICSPMFWNIRPAYKELPMYLYTLDSYLSRKAFLLARLNSFTSNVSWGRFNHVLASERYCLHGCEVPDTLIHIVLDCPAFSAQRAEIQDYLTGLKSRYSSKFLIIKSMLSERDVAKLIKVANAIGNMLRVNSHSLSLRKDQI